MRIASRLTSVSADYPWVLQRWLQDICQASSCSLLTDFCMQNTDEQIAPGSTEECIETVVLDLFRDSDPVNILDKCDFTWLGLDACMPASHMPCASSSDLCKPQRLPVQLSWCSSMHGLSRDAR